jgi:hypothetical protein
MFLMKYFMLVCFFFSFTLPAHSQSFKKIFNGKDISGWTVHGSEKWYVTEGVIVGESGADKDYGYLSTNKNYKNYILKLAFKLNEKGNSGVFIRSGIEGTKISGWQVEVAPPDQHTGGIYESYGRGWLIQPKSGDEKWMHKDDWNYLRIRLSGDEITTWLNGKKMVFLKDDKIGAGVGFIALQIHTGGDTKVSFKDIRIKELK